MHTEYEPRAQAFCRTNKRDISACGLLLPTWGITKIYALFGGAIKFEETCYIL